MIKGAPVKTEARAIPGASATTEVQNNILLAASDPADASVVLLCRSSCMILLPLELCLHIHSMNAVIRAEGISATWSAPWDTLPPA